MNLPARILLFSAITFALGVASAPPVSAGTGVDDKIRSSFDAMVNTTNPNLAMGAERGVITGGGISVRNRVVNASLFNFQAPSISGGCGGWDLFAGSFSFISSEQIVTMLRGIASAAATYFFQLALSTISTKIESLLSEIFAKMNLANLQNINSCRVGEAIARAALNKTEGAQGESFGKQLAAGMGWQSDNSDAEAQGEAKSGGVQAAERAKATMPPEVVEQIVQGNQIWNAMLKQSGGWGGTSWFDGASKKTLEQIMSMTGTQIVCSHSVDPGCAMPAGGAPRDQETLSVFFREPTLSLRDIVLGLDQGNAVNVWRCNEYDKCLNPKASVEEDFVGTKKLILDKLLGATYGDGLIGRYHDPNLGLSAADRQLVGFGGAYVRMAMNLAVRDEEAARSFVATYADVIAAQITSRIVGQLLDALQHAAGSLESGASDKAQSMVSVAKARMLEDLNTFYAMGTVNAEIYAYYSTLMDTMDKPAIPAPAASF